jgi:hypothetical protein
MHQPHVRVVKLDDRAEEAQRAHQGRECFGKTPMQPFLASAGLAREKPTPTKAT